MSSDLIALLAREAGRLIAPLSEAAQNDGARERLLGMLGLTDSAGESAALVTAFTSVAEIYARIEQLVTQSSLSLKTIDEILGTLRQIFATLQALDEIEAGDELAGIGADLFNLLFGIYLARFHPTAGSLAVLATLIEPATQDDLRPAVVRDEQLIRAPSAFWRLCPARLIALIQDPVATLQSTYGDSLATLEDANAVADKLFPRVQTFLRSLGVSCRYGIHPRDAESLGEAASFLDRSLIIYADDVLAGAAAEAGIVLSLSSADRGDLGLVVSPFGTLTSTRCVGAWTIEVSANADVDAFSCGRNGFALLAEVETTAVQGSVSATLAAPEEGPAFVFGAETGTRLEVGGAQLKIATALSQQQQTLELSADISSAALIIAAGDGDSFLDRLLPAEGVRVDFDLGLAWSNTRGVTLRGSAGLEMTLPIGKSIGGFQLTTLYLKLQAQDQRLITEVSAGINASIGPVQVAIDRVGLATDLSFPQTGGNLGVADLDFRFKPPSGMGLAIDVASVVGGGYLFFDSQKGEYGGVLQLEIAGQIAVKAVGLLSTRLPDGAKGYSLIVLITAEDFKSIPLGMGFNLVGLGGLLAINRTFAAAAMQAGLKNNTLATLLFPRDPILNAPQILRNLATLFPARSGSYLFAPMAKVTWASAKLIQMDLALIMEFGHRRRLIVLGRISSILPSRDEDLLRLNMDAMGIWDFDVGTVSLDAVLVDSRLLQKFVLTGSMAMRACLVPGPQAGFALAVGGMNPHFSPPAGMPKLDRITINLTSGDNPRFTCNAYFAITANTLQFGARASMYAAACGFSIEGDVSFDVLMQLLPFRFLADYSASIQLKHGSRNLFKVKVSGALEGPRPLRVSAKATFEILWCDFSIRFDKTLMDGEAPALPPPIDVLSVLKSALAAPENWNTELPESRRHGVTLRKLPANAALTLDPLGSLTVKQNVVPLNTHRDIDTFGGAPVGAVRRFTITAAALSGTAQSIVPAPVKDLFAPAQFFDLSEEQKLSSPSFESMDSGAQFGSDAVFIDEVAELRANAPLEYETLTVDADGVITTSPAHYELSAERLMQQLRFASVSKAAVRHAGLARFRTTAVEPAVTLTPLRWVVASTTDLNTLAPLSSTGASWADASGVLQTMLSGSPANASKWQLVPQYEVAP